MPLLRDASISFLIDSNSSLEIEVLTELLKLMFCIMCSKEISSEFDLINRYRRLSRNHLALLNGGSG